MLITFYPNHKLLVDEELKKEQLSQVQSSAEKQVYVDVDKVSDSGYLDKLLGEETKQEPTIT